MELKDYLFPLRRWWWLLAAATLIAATSSFIYTYSQPPTYRARTTVMVGSTMQDPNPNNNQFWLAQQLARTYADIAGRTTVRQATMDALALTWLPAYSVWPVPNTQIIEITVTDVSPLRARAVAEELVLQLIRLSPDGNEEKKRQDFVEQQLDDLETQITGTEDEILRSQDELAEMFSARQIADTQQLIDALDRKLNTLQSNYAALLANTRRGSVNTLTVVEPAALPTDPIGSNMNLNIMVAAIIGLVLAAGGAYLLEYMDDSIKTPDEAQKLLDIAILGTVPMITEGTTDSDKLIMLSSNQTPSTEAYRVLRTNLQFATIDKALNVLLVTSPSPEDGKSLTAANLSAALAHTGKRVILLDADLRRPRQHRLFKLINNVGVTTALLGQYPSIDRLLQKTAIPRLHVLTSGPIPPNPAELLGSKRMQDLLVSLQDHADIVVIDSPPVTAVSDTVVLSTKVDGVLLVLNSGKTRREAANWALTSLKKVGANMLGFALNGIPISGAGYYYNYNYHYSYGYGYTEDGLDMGKNGVKGGSPNVHRNGAINGGTTNGAPPSSTPPKNITPSGNGQGRAAPVGNGQGRDVPIGPKNSPLKPNKRPGTPASLSANNGPIKAVPKGMTNGNGYTNGHSHSNGNKSTTHK